METVKIRCKDLMVGDYIANRNGSPMQIVEWTRTMPMPGRATKNALGYSVIMRVMSRSRLCSLPKFLRRMGGGMM